MSKYGVVSDLYFLVLGPEITPYLNTFHAVIIKNSNNEDFTNNFVGYFPLKNEQIH